MAKQRYINTSFWDDSYIVELDPIEKLLFLYFITNPLTSLSGAYEISLKRIAFDTGIDKEMVSKIIQRFTKADKIYYQDGWILLKNFSKHQSSNPSIQKGIAESLKCCPDWIKDRLYTGSIQADNSLSDSIVFNVIESDCIELDVSDTSKPENPTTETATTLKTKNPKLSDEEWLESLRTSKAYQHINLDLELEKALIWCNTNNRQRTRKFMIGWLNRIQPPIKTEATNGISKDTTIGHSKPMDSRERNAQRITNTKAVIAELRRVGEAKANEAG